MPYTWILFDADGTLFDYDQAEINALEGAFHDLGLPFIDDYIKTYRAINLQVWQDFEAGRVSSIRLRTLRFERLFEAAGINANPADFSRCYLARLARQSVLMPDAEETVRALSRQSQMAIVTNGLKDVQRPRLAGSPIADHFAHMIISEEVGAAKPHPAYFEFVLDHIGRPPLANILIVGDSLTSDIQGGINAGIDTCWYNPLGLPNNQPVRPRYVIRTLTEILRIV